MSLFLNGKSLLISLRNSSLAMRGIFNIPKGVKAISVLNPELDYIKLFELGYGGNEFKDTTPHYVTPQYLSVFKNRKREQPRMSIIHTEWSTIYGSRGAIATKSGFLIEELSQEFGEARLDINKHPVFHRLTKFNKRKLLGKYLFICAPGSDTYAHWVFDTLPRLILAHESGLFESADKLILSYRGHGFQIETLNWLKIPQEKIINIYNNNDLCLQLEIVRTITYPNKFNTVSSWIPFKLKSFYELNRRNRVLTQPEFVFIDRRDHRKIINSDFYMTLKKYNFSVVYSEDIAEADKLCFFQRTKILINLYGSGGQNVIFCSQNCLNLTIVTENHLNSTLSEFIDVYGWTLNNGGGYRTAIIVGKAMGNQENNWCPIEINMNEFENLLIQEK
jgi:capsular polysaccharide biosynthesis protein